MVEFTLDVGSGVPARFAGCEVFGHEQLPGVGQLYDGAPGDEVEHHAAVVRACAR